MQPGDIVTGKVTGIKEYGAFVKVGEYSGLIHISEFSNDFVSNISDIVSLKEEVSVMIMEIDEENKKLKLSYKRANVMPSRLLKRVHIFKGFNALELALDGWIEKEYNKIHKGEEEKWVLSI